MYWKQAHLLQCSKTHSPCSFCVFANVCKCGRKTPVRGCYCLGRSWRCAEVSRSADESVLAKGKWGMKGSCGGNHDNFNYSRDCWTESALYNIIQRGSDTPQRADGGKSNHTCSIQHALDTRVTTEMYDFRKREEKMWFPA